MNYLTADEAMRDWLGGLVEPVEIRDPSGKIMGHYTPVLSPEEKAFYARAHEFFDSEEFRQRKEKERTGATLEEMMQHLKSLEKPE